MSWGRHFVSSLVLAAYDFFHSHFRFVVWETRHGTFKIKSVLKGTETEGEFPPFCFFPTSQCNSLFL